MSWAPDDLITDQDLVAYEADILTNFGHVEWEDRRSKALEDWLFPQLVVNGFPPHRLRTRYVADAMYGFTSGVYTDLKSAAADQTSDDINLATIFATPGTDAIYVGSAQPFRGLSIRMLDSVSSVTGQLSVSLWSDAWQPIGMTDGTRHVSGKSLSGGGSVTWMPPFEWVERPINSSPTFYYAKVMMSAVPTGAKASQISVIRRSLLCAAVTFRTLALIFREAPTSQDGPWTVKADWYETQAQAAFERVLPFIGGEFDTETVDDVIDQAEAVQTAEDVTHGGWSLERA